MHKQPSLTRERSRSVPRLGAIVKTMLSPRKSMAGQSSAVHQQLDVPPLPDASSDYNYPSLPPRISSLSSTPSQSSIEFKVLPIAPASFERRRPSSSGLASPSSSSSLNRRSVSSFASLQRKSEEEIGGIYGWGEEETAVYNKEYVEFMKTKGINVSLS